MIHIGLFLSLRATETLTTLKDLMYYKMNVLISFKRFEFFPDRVCRGHAKMFYTESGKRNHRQPVLVYLLMLHKYDPTWL